MTKAEKLELELRRESLLKKSAKLRDVTEACQVATRCATRHKALAEHGCNGIPKEYDARRKEWIMGLSEDDSKRINQEMKTCRDKALRALRSILTPGLEYDFQNDHAYCMVRVRDKENRRAFSL
jgi:hypothetical protein